MKTTEPVSYDSGILFVLRIGVAIELLVTASQLITRIIQKGDFDKPALGLVVLFLVEIATLVYASNVTSLDNNTSITLPLLLAGTTISGVALPWLTIQPYDYHTLLVTTWLLIPATLVPLLALSIRYKFLGVILYVLTVNALDVVLYFFCDGFVPFSDINESYLITTSFFTRILVMVSLGHMIVYFARMVSKNHNELLRQNEQIALMNEQLELNIEERTKTMQMVNQMTLQGWVRLLELRDFETEGHCSRVADLTGKLTASMGCPPQFIECVKTGALLHDIGKLGIPDDILLKRGKLNELEKLKMEQHISHGYNVLQGVSFLEPCLEIVLHHHERWDGQGYPQGLKGEEIPFAARLFSVVDVWDALTSDRPYRGAWTEEEATNYLADQAGHQFDPMVVKAFLNVLKHRPLETIDILDRNNLRDLLLLTISQDQKI